MAWELGVHFTFLNECKGLFFCLFVRLFVLSILWDVEMT